jgi:hypothetical protein
MERLQFCQEIATAFRLTFLWLEGYGSPSSCVAIDASFSTDYLSGSSLIIRLGSTTLL